MQRDCSVKDDWGEKDVEKEVCGEQGEGIDQVNPGDEKANKPAQDDENAGFGQQLLQPVGVVEEDLEDKGRDDDKADHHLTLETTRCTVVDVFPPPSVEMDTLPVMVGVHVASILMASIV